MDYRQPAGFPWNYDRGEIIADGVIHAIGICFGLIGAVIIIIIIASHSTKIVTIASVLIYAIGLLAVLGFSAAYNMGRISHAKWILRRFTAPVLDPDHLPKAHSGKYALDTRRFLGPVKACLIQTDPLPDG